MWNSMSPFDDYWVLWTEDEITVDTTLIRARYFVDNEGNLLCLTGIYNYETNVLKIIKVRN